jgi:hypothetical protein
MDEQAYLAFQQCRLANFMSKGKQAFVDWLNLDGILIDRKDLDLFAYLLRVLITAIVDTALRSRSIELKLVHLNILPITVEQYHDAVETI